MRDGLEDFMATLAQVESNVNVVTQVEVLGSRIESSVVPVIQAEDVHKYYDLGETKVHALRGVNLKIEPGEFVAIMGSSGSGKSGFVFQGFNLLSRTTALENVELPTLYAHMEKTARLTRAKEVMEMVGLGGRLDHFPSQLSGGQQQRVAIARALVNRPAILLADEPTGNLDSRTSVEIMQIFQELNDSGLTIVLVTHEPDVAQFAKRIVVFRDGKIRHDDPVRERPRAAEVLKSLPAVDE